MDNYLKYIWFNGSIVKWDQANIHVMSHVLHYGSGVFAGIKCYNTKLGPAIFRLEDHIDRLFNSALMYEMKVPYNRNDLIDATIKIITSNSISSGYIRPIIFHGYKTLGVHPRECPIHVAIATFNWGSYLGDQALEKGVKVGISKWKKYPQEAMPSTAKACGQYMNSLLAVRDARNRGFDEALLLNTDGNVAEGSGQNIFIVKNNVVYTNDEKACILLGITRDTILNILDDNKMDYEIKDLSVDDLESADEVFFSGTASEITPISSIDQKNIGTGMPGTITKKIQKIYLDIVNGENSSYYNWLTFINKKK